MIDLDDTGSGDVDVSIDCIGDIDVYRIDVSSIELLIVSTCDTGGLVDNTNLALLDNNGNQLATSNNNCGLGSRSRVEYFVPQDVTEVFVAASITTGAGIGSFGVSVRAGEWSTLLCCRRNIFQCLY